MQDKSNRNALRIRKGVKQPPPVNPDVLTGKVRKKKKEYSADEYVAAILSGNRTILSQAITLAESSLPDHYDMIHTIVEKCLPYSGHSIRIGITGVPGAGKSTFIESLGLYLTELGRRPAVLAVDPSSDKTGGSILGDKTRMEKLSVHPNAFVRPSPAAGTPGGVAGKTRETIILCEAAGFDTILVETVGVGQSETTVHSMVDFFLLLMLAGAGDELQGIKRGIMEMADAIAITKADGQNILRALDAGNIFRNALRLFPVSPSGWKPEVLTCSALENKGINEIWELIIKYASITKENGYFEERRKQQSIARMHEAIAEYLHKSFYNNKNIRMLKASLEKKLYEGKLTSYKAASELIEKYNKDNGA
ncbi:MAG: methylmalonyl Co-A mutase-associated GTPase MeaB [Bacteroidales bacterium]|nr:methylmalonyl Co-A mutase-associated GTPase MeaB [Bacteroidales bacterium]